MTTLSFYFSKIFAINKSSNQLIINDCSTSNRVCYLFHKMSLKDKLFQKLLFSQKLYFDSMCFIKF